MLHLMHLRLLSCPLKGSVLCDWPPLCCAPSRLPFSCGIASAPSFAERYRMPWEEKLEKQPVISPDVLHIVKVVRDKMEIVHLPLVEKPSSHQIQKLQISTYAIQTCFLSLADYVGETSVVVAGDGLEPIWSGTVTVTDFEEEEDEE